MSIHFYTQLKAWRQARLGGKRPVAEPPKPGPDARSESSNAAVYAAGIACAGQVAERTR